MDNSIGFIETKGYVGAIEAADAMAKAAAIKIVKWHKTGAAMILVVIMGELDACQAAVAAGKTAAEKTGELVSWNVIARPYEELGIFLDPKTERRGEAQSPPPQKTPNKNVKQKATKANLSAVKNEKSTAINTLPKAEELKLSVMTLAQNSAKGISLKKASDLLKLEQPHLRVIFKKLMDEGKIIKIRKLYFKASEK
jgi:ethanolamine utilization protein EutM